MLFHCSVLIKQQSAYVPITTTIQCRHCMVVNSNFNRYVYLSYTWRSWAVSLGSPFEWCHEYRMCVVRVVLSSNIETTGDDAAHRGGGLTCLNVTQHVWCSDMYQCDMSDAVTCINMTCLMQWHVSIWHVWWSDIYQYDMYDGVTCINMTCLIEWHVSIWHVWWSNMYKYDMFDRVPKLLWCLDQNEFKKWEKFLEILFRYNNITTVFIFQK